MKKDLVTRPLGYGISVAASNWPHSLIGVYLLFYLTEYVGISPLWAGFVLTAPRIWDMIMDIPIGRLSDKFAYEWGGRHRLALWSSIVLAALLPLTFYVPPTTSAFLIVCFFAIVGMAHASAFSAFCVSYVVLADEISETATRRNTMIASAAVCSVVFNVALTATVPRLIDFGGGGQSGYLLMTLALVLPAALCFTCGYFAVLRPSQQTPLVRKSVEKQRLLPQLRRTFVNKGYWMVTGVLFCHTIGIGCVGALTVYANKYLLGRQAEDVLILYAPMAVATVLGLPLAVPLAKRLGSAAAIKLGVTTQTAGLFFLWNAMVYAPALLIPAGLITGFATGAMTVWLIGAVLDITKDEVAGVSRGIYLGIYYAIQKLGQSLGGMVAGAALAVVGFEAGMAPGPDARFDIALITLVCPFVPLGIGTWLAWRAAWKSSSADAEPPAALSQPESS